MVKQTHSQTSHRLDRQKQAEKLDGKAGDILVTPFIVQSYAESLNKIMEAILEVRCR